MAKDKAKVVEEKPNKQDIPVNKISTIVTLKSRANYIIEIIENNVHKFIQPFGKLKVDRSKLEFTNEKDAKYLTFIK